MTAKREILRVDIMDMAAYGEERAARRAEMLVVWVRAIYGDNENTGTMKLRERNVRKKKR